MRLQLNGGPWSSDEVTNIADLLVAARIDHRSVAVELNFEIVPRSAYARTGLADGDRIEIVHFIGGG